MKHTGLKSCIRLSLLSSLLMWGCLGFTRSVVADPGQSAGSTLLIQAPSQGRLFRWKFDKQKTYHWETTSYSKLAVPGEGKLQGVEQSLTFDFDIQVLKQNAAAGTNELKFKLTRVRSSHDSPRNRYDYDSKEGVKETDLNFMKRLVAGTLSDLLLGIELKFQINSRGEVSDVKMDEKLRKRIQGFYKSESPGALLEERGLNSLFLGGLVTFPELPCKIGDHWKQSYTTSENEFGSFVLNFSPHYVGGVKVKDKQLEKFDLQVQLKQGKPSYIPMKLGKQESSGYFYFDPEAEILRESQWKVDTEIVIEETGGKLQMVMSGKSRFRLAEEFKKSN
ncbi:MAG: hypothetical protein K0U86_01995 [Planctomycetes bacterium]|nr:hypothetical protein [Planctomycetota bacterium]MCH9723659.1 hypothetical protein [Planctomycetota bacterium]MCH9778477.1 hypothetical protein [Planctomycetota bacterium]MCH9791557.1 hypothetical protein [Planctomycetota bacterium]